MSVVRQPYQCQKYSRKVIKSRKGFQILTRQQKGEAFGKRTVALLIAAARLLRPDIREDILFNCL
jgi:hypothetical protein